MALHEEVIEYVDGDVCLKGFFCYDPGRVGPLPGVLVSPTVAGRDALMESNARRLAAEGYAALALDMYGEGKVISTPEEKATWMGPFKKDRLLLRRRITAALTQLRALPVVDARRVAAVGYCFGGMCVLDLARSGAELRGVVSLHGTLAPNGLPPETVKAKVLILHGFDDPLAKPEDMLAVMQEFTAAGADWQLHSYGRTSHAFTNPQANSPDGGLKYQPDADRRSWQAMLNFLSEVLR